MIRFDSDIPCFTIDCKSKFNIVLFIMFIANNLTQVYNSLTKDSDVHTYIYYLVAYYVVSTKTSHRHLILGSNGAKQHCSVPFVCYQMHQLFLAYKFGR